MRRFWTVLGAGMTAGLLLIHGISRPDAVGGGPRVLKLSEIQPGEAVAVERVGSAFSLRAAVPAEGAPVRLLDVPWPEGFATGTRSYALAGEVSYRTSPESAGFLEVVSVGAGAADAETRSVSRTWADGLQAPLRGESMWRPFATPFTLEPGAALPRSLELNAGFPLGGTVEVRDLALVDGWGNRPGAWFSMAENRVFEAIVGTLLGLWGTLLAIGQGLWPERASGPVLASCILWVLAGGICLVAVAWACLAGQPWWVRQQLALYGVLLCALGGGFFGWRMRCADGAGRAVSAS